MIVGSNERLFLGWMKDSILSFIIIKRFNNGEYKAEPN
jgi:hypothetical protein